MEVTTDTSGMDKVLKEFEMLNQFSLEIGVFGSDDSFMAMLANVHEFGITIRPKGKWLTIPTKEAGDRSAREIQGLFKPRGVNALAIKDERKRGKNKNGFIVMFWLVKEVVIPERSFLRSAFDEKEEKWSRYFDSQLSSIVDGSLSAEDLYDRLGARIASDIQKQMRDLKNPSKSAATLQRNPSKTNPLIDTGRLLQSVTWKVVRN